MEERRHQPGPGLSTSQAAFNEHKKQVAQRNEQVQREGRKARKIGEQAKAAKRRRLELL